MTEETPRYYVHYQDDGRAGVSPSSDTSPWDRLYVFSRPKAMLDFIHDVGEETFRLNARVVGFWSDGDGHKHVCCTAGSFPRLATSHRRPNHWRGEGSESRIRYRRPRSRAHDRQRGARQGPVKPRPKGGKR